MFAKQAIVIATASGPVFSKTLNEMKDSLDFWGVAKTYKIGAALMEVDWGKVSPKIKSKIARKINAATTRIKKKHGTIKPCFRVKKWFYISRFMQKKMKMNPADIAYWQSEGWLEKIRPWHKESKKDD